jgi:hypothetical protein
MPDIVLVQEVTDVTLVQEAPVTTLIESQGAVGPPGATGPTGPTGGVGPPGPIGGNYLFVQSVPAAVWTIVHNLGFFPNSTVVDTLGRVVEGDEAYPDANTLVLSFTAAFSGTAYLS